MGKVLRPDAFGGPREWKIERNAASDSATVYLYGAIGFEENDASEFVRELEGITEQTINLRVNSPGGDVFDGLAIYNALANHPATVNVYVDGLAASAASFIAMAGDRVTMQPHSRMMIHDAMVMRMDLGVYNAASLRAEMEELEKLAQRLDDSSDNIAGIYQNRTGKDGWRDAMVAETWFSDKEAVEIGLADEVGRPNGRDAEREAAKFDLSTYQHVPERLVALHQEMNEEPADDRIAALEERIAALEAKGEEAGSGDAPGDGEKPVSDEERRALVDRWLAEGPR